MVMHGSGMGGWSFVMVQHKFEHTFPSDRLCLGEFAWARLLDILYVVQCSCHLDAIVMVNLTQMASLKAQMFFWNMIFMEEIE